MLAAVSSWTTFQVRLRPREAAVLAKMASDERRRPQDQAAVLIAHACEAWLAEQEALVYDPSEIEELEAEA